MTNGVIIESKYPTTKTLFQLEQYPKDIREHSGVMKLYKDGNEVGLITMGQIEDCILHRDSQHEAQV